MVESCICLQFQNKTHIHIERGTGSEMWLSYGQSEERKNKERVGGAVRNGNHVLYYAREPGWNTKHEEGTSIMD